MTSRHWLEGFSLVGGVALLVLLGSAGSSSDAPGDPPASPRATSYRLRLGSHVYHHYCNACHGKEGKGDGLNAFTLDTKPRDLTSPDLHRTRTDAQLAAVIEKGGADAGFSAAMPPWGRTLSSSERAAVLAYIRSLAATGR